jgi:hypothetical protein
MSNAAATESPAATPVRLAQLGQPFDPAAYLAPGSDQVALLVLGHQTQMHNLITLTNYKTRLALYANAPTPDAPLPENTRRQFERPAEQLLRYLLFINETPLPNLDAKQAIASSAFAREFAARGTRDSKGRSLRDFDLETRIFRYPCSYLIYSDAFDALPEPSRTYVYHRLLEILSGRDQSPEFSTLSVTDRQAILEILLETKQGLPDEWKKYATANYVSQRGKRK